MTVWYQLYFLLRARPTYSYLLVVISIATS